MRLCGAENAVMRVRKLPALWGLCAGLMIATGAASPPEKARVDINTASLQVLMQVPGLTRIWAARVVRFRPYRAKNNLLDRGILSPEIYSRVKDLIVVHRESEATISPQP